MDKMREVFYRGQKTITSLSRGGNPRLPPLTSPLRLSDSQKRYLKVGQENKNLNGEGDNLDGLRWLILRKTPKTPRLTQRRGEGGDDRVLS